MNAFASYNAINTKLHTRKRALFTTADWNKVLDYTTVIQLIEFLRKHFGYETYLEQSKTTEIHRGELEVILHRYLVTEIEKILHYFSGPYKAFLQTLLIQYEIYDLQLIMRNVAREESLEPIGRHFVHSRKYATLPYDKLLASKNINQVIEVLKGTEYYEVLKTTTQEDAVKREFHMEMKLEILYYRMLMDKAKKLSQEDQRVVEEMIGLKIDCLNIQWIYRATKYYDISKEEILIYSLPGGSISYKGLKKLIYAKSLEEFKLMVDKLLKYPLFAEKEDVFLEKNIDTLMYRYLKKVGEGKSIAMPLKYIYRLEIEIKDLTAATEGIRYGLDKQEIKKYLVTTL